MLNADPACGCIVHAEQHGERLDAVGRLSIERLVALVIGLRARHPGADKNTSTTQIQFAQPDLRISERIARSDQRKLTDAVEHAQLREIEMLGPVKGSGRSQRRDQSVRERRVEAVNARAPGAGVLEYLLAAVAER